MNELMKWLSDNMEEIKVPAYGAAIWFYYVQFVKKKQNLFINLGGFAAGTIASMYVSPQIQKLWTTGDPNFISFFTGLLSMQFIQAILEINWKRIIQRKLESELETNEKAKLPFSDN